VFRFAYSPLKLFEKDGDIRFCNRAFEWPIQHGYSKYGSPPGGSQNKFFRVKLVPAQVVEWVRDVVHSVRRVATVENTRGTQKQ
jgi:hypothetical protein